MTQTGTTRFTVAWPKLRIAVRGTGMTTLTVGTTITADELVNQNALPDLVSVGAVAALEGRGVRLDGSECQYQEPLSDG